MTSSLKTPIPVPVIECGGCHFRVMDGEVLRARVLRFAPHPEAKCPRCKAWVVVPVVLDRSVRG